MEPSPVFLNRNSPQPFSSLVCSPLFESGYLFFCPHHTDRYRQYRFEVRVTLSEAPE